jgi:hypothetical protein
MRNRKRPIHCENDISERAGSLLLDALLAIVIFGAVVGAFSSAVFEGRQGSTRGGDRIRATYLAQEGLEGVRAVRDAAVQNDPENSFDTFVSGYTTDTDYGVKLSGAAWAIVAGPTTIDSVFTRTIRFYAGSDGDERRVESKVTWTEPGDSKFSSVKMNTFLTNFSEDPPPPPPKWSIPIIEGSFTDIAFDEPVLQKIAVVNNHAIIAADGDTTNGIALFVVDVSNIASPSLVNSIDLGWISAYDIAVKGNYAYIPTNDPNNEIKIVDVTNPATAHCSPCAGQINLGAAVSAPPNAVSITGTGLFIVRPASTEAELYVYDIGDNPTAPTLIRAYETDPSTDNLYAVTATGSNPMAYYAYIASGTSNDEELRVISLTGGTLTGNGSAGISTRGTAIAVYNTGAYVGALGSDLCEVYSFDIANKVHNPNAALLCGGNQGYDLAGDSDLNEQPTDMDVQWGGNLQKPHLFMSTNTLRSGVNHYLHILDISNVRNIASTSQKIYDGSITAGYSVENGLFYRASDHRLFMVGGGVWSTSHLLIMKPTFGY